MLLLNILPKREVRGADGLSTRRSPRTMTPRASFSRTCAEFTPMAATMTPLQLVDLLTRSSIASDNLVEKYSLEKIKTIGDCYMVAAGVPRSRPDHARRLWTGARYAGCRRSTQLRRRKLRLSHRHQFWTGGAGVIGRKKHLSTSGCDAVNAGQPHEIAWAARRRSRSPAIPMNSSRRFPL